MATIEAGISSQLEQHISIAEVIFCPLRTPLLKPISVSLGDIANDFFRRSEVNVRRVSPFGCCFHFQESSREVGRMSSREVAMQNVTKRGHIL